MKTLREMEREAMDWQEDAAFAHKLATQDNVSWDNRRYWQIKGRKYSALAMAALDACNIMRSWE